MSEITIDGRRVSGEEFVTWLREHIRVRGEAA